MSELKNTSNIKEGADKIFLVDIHIEMDEKKQIVPDVFGVKDVDEIPVKILECMSKTKTKTECFRMFVDEYPQYLGLCLEMFLTEKAENMLKAFNGRKSGGFGSILGSLLSGGPSEEE